MDLVRHELGCRCQKHVGNACHSQDYVDVKSFGAVILGDSMLGRKEIQLLGGIDHKNLDHDMGQATER
jgi:hypothetical protein